jgi:polyisoprenoid-binding protein YceI
MRSNLPSFATLLLLAAAPSAAHAGLQVAGTPKVAFEATMSPSFMSMEGASSVARVNDDGAALLFSVPFASVSTGIDLRDDHMRDNYLDVARFPDATLKLEKATLVWPQELKAAQSGTVKADFTVHGVTKPVDVAYTLRRSKTGWRVDASFAFDVSQHGIAIPTYTGVTVDPKMSAKVTLDLVDAQ